MRSYFNVLSAVLAAVLGIAIIIGLMIPGTLWLCIHTYRWLGLIP